ncbi:MAG: carboxypeptidase-like regulatory domain-containing protein [Bacteroidetes bacterium]|nr:carboxypeptidase-like regulatory domain-containing protein [Bacteroidota bacterium]
MTIVKGMVIDATTNEPLPLVTIAFKGTSIGTTSDFDGTFVLESKWASGIIEIASLGYETQTLPIQLGMKQEVNVSLVSTSLVIATVEVKAKKGKYKRRDNPAVELMRNVIDHKKDNRIEAVDFYEVGKYEKIEFDINNFDPEKLKKRRAFKKFQFMFDYLDTSEMNGKPFLPFFIQESSSKVYYRNSPESMKEHREGVKVTGMEEYVDSKDLTTMTEVLYQKINIYDDNIRMLDLAFMSPLSPLAIGYYRFYIIDSTAVVNGYPVTKVSFYPVNNQNIAFKGDLFILRDSSYAVVKADFGLTRQVNVNFVQDLRLVQEFKKMDGGVWAKDRDKVVVDFAIRKKDTGFYGTRDVFYKDYVLHVKRDDETYVGTEKIIDASNAYKRSEEFWQTARHDTLSSKERGAYEMIDTLQRVPAFRTTMTVLALLATGYKAFGPVDVGPIANFYSFNPVEGFRMKLGGETNLKFHPKLSLSGYGAYGFDDRAWKYGGGVLYSFRDDFKMNPKHYVRLAYQHDVSLVGQILYFNSPDNFFLSFQRGSRDRMLFLDRMQAEYMLELRNHLSWLLSLNNTTYQPYGATLLNYYDPETEEPQSLSEFSTSEIGLQIRFAPNEQYLQGRTYRTSFFNKYPIFTLRLATGLKDVLGGDYSYNSASLNVTKRFYMSFIGTMRMDFEAGKYWGEGLPYFLLNLPRANQTYAYRTLSFNMMNYQEFVSDEYAWLMLEHNFNGFIFNKIPLIRKLKLREAVTFKAIYGRLTDNNNPEKNPSYIQFLENDEGQRVTYTLEDKPYVEAGVAVSNIFKVIRLDLVRRLTYLDNPEVPSMFGVKGLGLRARLRIEF